MLEYFLKQAEELSAEKEVVLYFDEAEIGLMGKIRGDKEDECFG